MYSDLFIHDASSLINKPDDSFCGYSIKKTQLFWIVKNNLEKDLVLITFIKKIQIG